MKRKIGFVAAVILLGVFVVACNQKPAEPASTSAPSPTPAATGEPAASDLPSDSVIVEDTGLSQPVKQVTEEGPTNEGATYESEAEFDQKFSAEAEKFMQGYMDRGHTREEAEAWWQDRVEAGQQAQDQQTQTIQERQEEEAARMEQEKQQADKEYDEFCMEHYGTTGDHWNSMTIDEKLQWKADHPMN